MEGYTIVRMIGPGTFGVAKLARKKETNEKCVIKVINMSDGDIIDVKNEVKVLSSLSHPYVVQYLESFIHLEQMCIVYEYCSGGDLQQHIKEQAGLHFDEGHILDWFVQICLGLKYLHNKKIIHGNLKPATILITGNERIKLGGFSINKEDGIRGLPSKTVAPWKLMHYNHYASLEVIENRSYCYKSDIWALGCILYEMASLEPAFNAKSLLEVFMKIRKGSYAPLPRGKYSQDLGQLLTEILQKDPKSRPTTSNILEKPFILRKLSRFLNGCDEEKLLELSELQVAVDKGDAARLKQLLTKGVEDLDLGTIQRLYEYSVLENHSPNIIKMLETTKNNKECLDAADKGDVDSLKQLLGSGSWFQWFMQRGKDLDLEVLQQSLTIAQDKRHSADVINTIETAQNKKVKEIIDGYKILRTLGAGSFAIAHLAEKKETKKWCVLKITHKLIGNTNEQQEAENEVKVLSSLQHPYVIRYLESFVYSGKLHIVMDYGSGGDLQKEIKNQMGIYFEEGDIIDWFAQMCLAMKYLNDKKILHRDIKPANILLMRNGRIKMADFGTAKKLEHTLALAETKCGTPLYMSPQMIQYFPCDDKNDIWALGCVLYQMATLELAFTDGQKIVQCSYAPIQQVVQGKYCTELMNLLPEILQYKPESRPSALDILKKPFMLRRLGRFIKECKEDELSKLIESFKK